MKKNYEKMTMRPLQVEPETSMMVSGSIQFGSDVEVKPYEEADCTSADFTVSFE